MKVNKFALCFTAILAGSMLLHMPAAAQGPEGQEAYIGKNAADTEKVWYETLEDALNQAESGDFVFLDKDAELEEDAKVSKGVTLVLPANGEGYTSKNSNPENMGTVSAPASERSISIPEGINLLIDGTVLVNAVTGIAKEDAASGYDVSGRYSQINLDGSIQVANGGLLDVYGYVDGSGRVIVESGGTLRDLMVIRNWRGLDYAINMYVWNVFPFNEYDLHNIRTDVRINSGGAYGGNLRIYGNGKYYSQNFLMVDNANGICRINPGGYLLKSYTGERETWDFYGGADFANAVYRIGGNSLNTANYFFALDGKMSVAVHNGSYSFQNLYKFMPGSRLTVAEDAEMTVEKGGKVALYTDAFRDRYTQNQTGYPSNRSGAVLNLDGRLHIDGEFGGNVIAGSKSGITYGKNASTTVRVSEASDEGMPIQNTVNLKVTGAVSYVLPDSISLNRQVLTMVPSEETALSVNFDPVSTTQRAISWASSNSGVVTVDGNGRVKASAPGKAAITAVTQNGKRAVCQVTVAPKPPKATLLSNYTVKLTWNKMAGAGKYEVYRATSKKGSYKRVNSASKLQYTDKVAKAGKTYYYKLKVNGVFSDPVSIKLIPEAPGKVKGSSKSGKVTVKWRKVSKAGGYRIYRSTSGKGRYKKAGDTKKNTYTDKNVKKKKTYYYKVKTWKKVDGKKVYSDFSKAFKIRVK